LSGVRDADAVTRLDDGDVLLLHASQFQLDDDLIVELVISNGGFHFRSRARDLDAARDELEKILLHLACQFFTSQPVERFSFRYADPTCFSESAHTQSR